jgi:hypothetical protein
MSIPKDGYYFANVWNDDGRAERNLVRFVNGVPHGEQGKRLGLACISVIKPAKTEELCALWPYASALELDTLRTANKALLERVERLEKAKEAKPQLCKYCMEVECECGDFDVDPDMGAK